jgi:DNA-binding CsgD family transcriptional regulator
VTRNGLCRSQLRRSRHRRRRGLPEEPLIFAKLRSSLIGPGGPIVLPTLSDQVDFEAELGVVAASEFDAFGAFRYRDQVDFQLRQLGGTIHRRSRPGQTDGRGVETLTGRELEVAELVLDRRTNREIAEMLFLSTKTVESHMRNIFNKLGVSSRVEVARTLSQAQV